MSNEGGACERAYETDTSILADRASSYAFKNINGGIKRGMRILQHERALQLSFQKGSDGIDRHFAFPGVISHGIAPWNACICRYLE